MPALSKKKEGLRTWIEVDRKAVRDNYRAFRALIPKSTGLIAVIKSNAYGHGLHDFAEEIARLGADMLAVDSAIEAFSLRERGVKTPILVLGFTLPDLVPRAIEEKVSFTVSSMGNLARIARIRDIVKARIHIKADTGMHRQGFSLHEKADLISFLKKRGIDPEGLFTHFAAAKNPAFPAAVRKQAEEFEAWGDAFARAGFRPKKHAAATSAALLFPETHYDFVRVGIGLFGLWPSPQVRAAREQNIRLRPVLSWRTVVSEVNDVSAGEGIGYDFTESLPRDGRVAILPIGYWHGYPRHLSGIGEALIRGKKAKVLGRVSMDMLIVDVSGISGAEAGDVATIIGRDAGEEITADTIAALGDTVNYEIVTRINPLIKKFYL
ncbi:alanine racemase [bacterium]|nr:alanine racemase [bacterium]MCI0566526.1 alanine racemase [bacterium]